jgi:hypothetical protein
MSQTDPPRAGQRRLEDSDLPDDIYPLQYQLIQTYQKSNKSLIRKIKEKTINYHMKSFIEAERLGI